VRSKLLISALLLLLLVSALAIYQLFVLRFENGDLFPPGSSLRSDPLGSMALYLALERTAGINLRRNYRPFDHQQPTGSTILLLGIDHQRLLTASKQDSAQLEQLAGRGNRVVIAFTPANGPATAAATGAGDQKNRPAPGGSPLSCYRTSRAVHRVHRYGVPWWIPPRRCRRRRCSTHV